MTTAFLIKEMSGESFLEFYLTRGFNKADLCPRNDDINHVSEEVLISFTDSLKLT
jgi:hypothetical protein